jgi:hypothetical protein
MLTPQVVEVVTFMITFPVVADLPAALGKKQHLIVTLVGWM